MLKAAENATADEHAADKAAAKQAAEKGAAYKAAAEKAAAKTAADKAAAELFGSVGPKSRNFRGVVVARRTAPSRRSRPRRAAPRAR